MSQRSFPVTQLKVLKYYLVDGVNDPIGSSNICLHHLHLHPTSINVKLVLSGPEPDPVLSPRREAGLHAEHPHVRLRPRHPHVVGQDGWRMVEKVEADDSLPLLSQDCLQFGCRDWFESLVGRHQQSRVCCGPDLLTELREFLEIFGKLGESQEVLTKNCISRKLQWSVTAYICLLNTEMFVQSVGHHHQWSVYQVDDPVLHWNVSLHNVRPHGASLVLLGPPGSDGLHDWN